MESCIRKSAKDPRHVSLVPKNVMVTWSRGMGMHTSTQNGKGTDDVERKNFVGEAFRSEMTTDIDQTIQSARPDCMLAKLDRVI